MSSLIEKNYNQHPWVKDDFLIESDVHIEELGKSKYIF